MRRPPRLTLSVPPTMRLRGGPRAGAELRDPNRADASAAVRGDEARRPRAVDVGGGADAPEGEAHRALQSRLAELRAAIVRYVGRQRADGVPLQRVLPQVTVLVRQAESAERWRDPAGELLAQAVLWCVEAYHDGPDADARGTGARGSARHN